MYTVSVHTLRPRQICCNFTDGIFKCIFLNENVWISLTISLKFVPKVRISNIPALVQIMAWHRTVDSHYLIQWWLIDWCIYASLGLDELMAWCLRKQASTQSNVDPDRQCHVTSPSCRELIFNVIVINSLNADDIFKCPRFQSAQILVMARVIYRNQY